MELYHSSNNMETSLTHCFNLITALRGFHVYYNTVNSNPYAGQEIAFKCEFNIPLTSSLFVENQYCQEKMILSSLLTFQRKYHDLFAFPYKKVQRYRQYRSKKIIPSTRRVRNLDLNECNLE